MASTVIRGGTGCRDLEDQRAVPELTGQREQGAFRVHPDPQDLGYPANTVRT